MFLSNFVNNVEDLLHKTWNNMKLYITKRKIARILGTENLFYIFIYLKITTYCRTTSIHHKQWRLKEA